MSEKNTAEAQQQLIVALNYMMAANARSSQKSAKVREWFKDEFNSTGRASRVSEAKQAYNRVPEQFRHGDQHVIFVVDDDITGGIIETQAKSEQYSGLNSCLVLTKNGAQYKPFVLLAGSESPVIQHYKAAFSGIRVEPLSVANTPKLTEVVSDSLESLPTWFCDDAGSHEFVVTLDIASRVACALLSKRFVILTGLAGSGKTKLSQALAEWLTPKRAASTDASPHFALIPVGADWTGNDNLVGYPNGLDNQSYNSKPALELMLHAKDQPEVPHFLILDEMNLSHVERYFADILSAMESEAAIPLYLDEQRAANGREIPKAIVLPPNLFIIGTVNVDETTYMFSPKVLDRANVIEFRMEADEIAAFLEEPKAVRLGELNGKGASFGQNFVAAAADKSRAVPEVVKAKFKEEMLLFFKLLQKHHSEFGYRTSYEAGRFMHFYKELGGYADDDATWFDAAMDAVIVQKLLPKLHGSRTKLEGLLWALGYACGADWGKMSAAEFQAACLEAGEAQNESKYSPEAVLDALKGAEPRYPLSFDKILRMYRKLVRDQFVTFAEA